MEFHEWGKIDDKASYVKAERQRSPDDLETSPEANPCLGLEPIKNQPQTEYFSKVFYPSTNPSAYRAGQ
jgi:hypothetical protein